MVFASSGSFLTRLAHHEVIANGAHAIWCTCAGSTRPRRGSCRRRRASVLERPVHILLDLGEILRRLHTAELPVLPRAARLDVEVESVVGLVIPGLARRVEVGRQKLSKDVLEQ